MNVAHLREVVNNLPYVQDPSNVFHLFMDENDIKFINDLGVAAQERLKALL